MGYLSPPLGKSWGMWGIGHSVGVGGPYTAYCPFVNAKYPTCIVIVQLKIKTLNVL